MAEGLLSGVEVLDLSQLVAGPYATKLLADHGADVIKVEPLTGDPSRRLAPFPGDVPHPERSGVFLFLNTSKRSMTVDVETPSGRRIVRQLADRADILVESFTPGTMERLGIGYEQLAATNPDLVVTSITPFGRQGPYAGFAADEITVYATSGVMSVTGVDSRQPLKLGDYATLTLGGASACAATLAAFFGAAHTGTGGQHVDFSLQESQAASMDRGGTNLAAAAASGDLFFERALSFSLSIIPTGNYAAADGFVHVTAMPTWWDRFTNMLDRPDMRDDPHFLTNLFNPELKEEVDAVFIPWLLDHDKQWIMEKGQREGFAITAINTMEDVFADPHLRHRGFFETLEHPETGPLEYPGPPFRPALTPRSMRRAPLLGEHTVEVLGELGYEPSDIVILRERGVV